MRSRSLLLLLIFFIFSLLTFSQSALGVELAVNNDRVRIEDSGGELLNSRILNVSGGLAYKCTFSNGLNVQAGIQLKQFSVNLRFASGGFGTSSTGNMVAQLPLIAGYNFYLVEKDVYLSPLLGAAINGMLLYGYGNSGGGSFRTRTDTLSYIYYNKDAQHIFLSANAGLLMGFNIGERFIFDIFMRYTHSFAPIVTQYVSYARNSGPVVQAKQHISGSYLTVLGLNVYYRLHKRTK